MTTFDLEPDITDRDLFLRVSWMRVNPGQPLPDAVGPEDITPDDAADGTGGTGGGRP
jgi:hypothetical protein